MSRQFCCSCSCYWCVVIVAVFSCLVATFLTVVCLLFFSCIFLFSLSASIPSAFICVPKFCYSSKTTAKKMHSPYQMHHIDRLQFNLFFILFLSFHVFSIYFFFSLCVRKWIFLAKQKPNNNTESKKM